MTRRHAVIASIMANPKYSMKSKVQSVMLVCERWAAMDTVYTRLEGQEPLSDMESTDSEVDLRGQMYIVWEAGILAEFFLHTDEPDPEYASSSSR